MILDEAIIEELREVLEEGFSELVLEFIERSHISLDDLQHAVSTKDNVKIKDLAHSLKGSSLNLGAVEFPQFCQALEKAATQGDDAVYAQKLDAVTQSFELIKNALLKLL